MQTKNCAGRSEGEEIPGGEGKEKIDEMMGREKRMKGGRRRGKNKR